MGYDRLHKEIIFDVKEEIVNTSFASDWAGCGCGEGGPGIPGTLGTMVTGLTRGIVVGICRPELVIDAGIATGMVWQSGSCKSTGKVPGTGLVIIRCGFGVRQWAISMGLHSYGLLSFAAYDRRCKR